MARHGTLPETSRAGEPEVETVPLAHGRDAVDTPRRFAGDPPVCPHTITNYTHIRVIRRRNPGNGRRRRRRPVANGAGAPDEGARDERGSGRAGRPECQVSGSHEASGLAGRRAVGTLGLMDQPVDRDIGCRMGLPEQPGRVNRASGVGEQGRPPGTPGLGQRLGRELRGRRSGGW